MRHNKTTTKIAAICTSILLAATSLAHADDQADADALNAAEKWEESILAYEALLQGDDKNSSNWFNLGRSRQHVEDYQGAIAAYKKTIETGYQPVARIQIYLARTFMLFEQKENALIELEKLAAAASVSFRSVQAIEEFAPLADEPRYQAVIAALTPCNTEEYRQFDFWQGQWDVTSAGTASPSASNEISRKHGGCVLLEQYVAGAFTGMSLNFYDANTQKWHQTWMSNSGGALNIEGGLNEKGQMVLSDADLPSSKITNTINRITWTPNPDGSVRQFWENSADGGETWSVAFDGLYTKAIPTE